MSEPLIGGENVTDLEEIHREEILERARRNRELARRQAIAPAVQESDAPEERPSPALSINDSASKARARLRGAQKQQGRTRAAKPAAGTDRRAEVARARMLRNHQDPVYEAKRIAAIRASWTPERRAAAGAALSARRKDPAVEARRLASFNATVTTRRSHQYTEDERERASVAAKTRLQDPRYREKFTSAGQRNLAAYNARRKASA